MTRFLRSFRWVSLWCVSIFGVSYASADSFPYTVTLTTDASLWGGSSAWGVSATYAVTLVAGKVTVTLTASGDQYYSGNYYKLNGGPITAFTTRTLNPGDSLMVMKGHLAAGNVFYGVDQTISGNVDLTQTVTLSPDGGSAAIVNGQTFSGQASGAEAGNPYNISIISGPGAAAINSSTGAYTVIANGAGLITYKVWASAGSGYERSSDAQASIAVTAEKRVRITIPANNTPYPISYRIMQDGAEIGYRLQQPGDGPIIADIIVSSDSPVTVVANVHNLDYTDNQWVDVPDTVTPVPLPNVPPITPSEDPTPVPLPTPNTPTSPPPTTPNPNAPVWTPPVSNNDPTQQVDLLTNTVYREGVSKTIVALNQIATVGARLLDNSDAEKDFRETQTSAVNATKTSLGDGSTQNQAAKAAGEAAGTEGQTKMTAAITEKLGPLPSMTPPTVGTVSDHYVVLDSARNIRIYTNPFSPNGAFDGVMGKLAAFVRALIAWGIVVAFYIWVLKEVSQTCEALFKVAPFSKSVEDSLNSVKVGGFGGGIGYFARTAGLLLLVPFVLTMPLIILAAATSNLPLVSIVAAMAGGAPTMEGGMLSDGAALADQVIPWAILMVSPLWYVAVQYGLLPSKFFWMMFAKFIPL